jgi:hypothetical protein
VGPLPVGGIRRKRVKALRDKYAEKPRTANYVVQVVRLLMSFAIDEEVIEDNPAARPRMLRTGEGHRPWEETEIEAYRKRWAQRGCRQAGEDERPRMGAGVRRLEGDPRAMADDARLALFSGDHPS